MNRYATGGAVVLAAALTLTGCSEFGKTNSDASAAAQAAATSTSAAYAKAQTAALAKKCVPQNAVTEARWAATLADLPLKRSKHHAAALSEAHAFETCAGVSPANDQKFQEQLGNKAAGVAKTALHDELTGNKSGAKAATRNFLENQVEQTAIADR